MHPDEMLPVCSLRERNFAVDPVGGRRGLQTLFHKRLYDYPENPKACPKLTARYKARPCIHCFFRTYSARIYFIGTNSSLACLHMPHPSNPVDDISARSYNREHGRFVRSRGRLDRVSSPSSEWIEVRTSELGVRLMDFIP